MAVLGWIIIVVFGLAYLFGTPYLLNGGRDYFKELGLWIVFLIVAAAVVALLLFAVLAVTGV